MRLIQLPGVDVTTRSPAEELRNPAKAPMDRRTLTVPNATIDPMAGHLPLASIPIPDLLVASGEAVISTPPGCAPANASIN